MTELKKGSDLVIRVYYENAKFFKNTTGGHAIVPIEYYIRGKLELATECYMTEAEFQESLNKQEV